MELLVTLALGGCAAVVALCKFVKGMAVQEVTLEDVPEGTREYVEAETARQSLELQLEIAEELEQDAATLNHLREQLREAEAQCLLLSGKAPELALHRQSSKQEAGPESIVMQDRS